MMITLQKVQATGRKLGLKVKDEKVWGMIRVHGLKSQGGRDVATIKYRVGPDFKCGWSRTTGCKCDMCYAKKNALVNRSQALLIANATLRSLAEFRSY